MSTLPDWEKAFSRIYCDQCGTDITFDEFCTYCAEGDDYTTKVVST